MTDVVQKLWGFCHTLRHDGIDYGDYIEQITYLLFLKMADERHPRRHLLRRPVTLQQPGEPQEAHQPHR
jgi:type I restriction-modification system DNA methylase subunit